MHGSRALHESIESVYFITPLQIDDSAYKNPSIPNIIVDIISQKGDDSDTLRKWLVIKKK